MPKQCCDAINYPSIGKYGCMITPVTSCEILLVTTALFCKKQLFGTDVSKETDAPSPEELFERAYQGGFLNKMLPGITPVSIESSQLFIWHIWQGESLLQIQLRKPNGLRKHQYSINPLLFFPLLRKN